MDLYLLYYLILLLLFGYFMLFHFQSMTLVRPDPSSSPSTLDLDPASINQLVEEIDEHSFYYHPTWAQRWSHPDFTGDCDRKLASWLKQGGDQTTRFLFSAMNYKFPWGFIIYRTVYTPESDEQWPIAMNILDLIINDAIDTELQEKIRRKNPEDPEPNGEPARLVRESRKDVIFSDKRYWNEAGTEQIRQHFREYLRASKGTIYGRFKGCLVIDEFCLKSIICSHNPQPSLDERPSDSFKPFTAMVGMIDGQYPDIRNDPCYTGFMRVYVDFLWDLYCQLCHQDMRESIPLRYLHAVPKGLIPVYDGEIEAQDEEGNRYGIELRRPERGPLMS